MKRSIFLLLIVALAAALVAPGPVKAQSNSGAVTWTSSIYYYNPNEDQAELAVDYLDNNGQFAGTTAPDENHKLIVPKHGSGEIYIGEVNVTTSQDKPGFKGSAVLSSSVPIAAIYEQSPNSGPNFSRLLYSAFSAEQASSKIYVPAFSRNTKGYMTQLGIQNTSDTPADITVDVYDSKGNTVAEAVKTDVRTQTSFIVNADPKAGQLKTVKSTTETDLSAIITIVKSATATTGSDPLAVAAAEELQMTGRRAYAFEAVNYATSGPIYMPTFACRSGAHGSPTSYYAIQNVGEQPTAVLIKAYKDDGTRIGKDYTSPVINPHGKLSFNACTLTKSAVVNGWATIQSVGGGTQLAVVGKVQGSGSDAVATAFTGMTSGADQIYLPYVLWTATPTKSYVSTISLVNTGGAGTAQLTFYRNDGKSFVYTVAIAANGKVTVDPKNGNKKMLPTTQSALRSDGSFRGAVDIQVTSADPAAPTKLISVVRMERKVSGVTGYTYFGEDYTGIPKQ